MPDSRDPEYLGSDLVHAVIIGFPRVRFPTIRVGRSGGLRLPELRMLDVTVSASGECAASRIEFSPSTPLRNGLDAAGRYSGIAQRALLGDLLVNLPRPTVVTLTPIPREDVAAAVVSVEELIRSPVCEPPCGVTVDAHSYFAVSFDHHRVRYVSWSYDHLEHSLPARTLSTWFHSIVGED